MIFISILIMAILFFSFYLMNKNITNRHQESIKKMEKNLVSLEINNKVLKDKCFINSDFMDVYSIRFHEIRKEVIELQIILFKNITSRN